MIEASINRKIFLLEFRLTAVCLIIVFPKVLFQLLRLSFSVQRPVQLAGDMAVLPLLLVVSTFVLAVLNLMT